MKIKPLNALYAIVWFGVFTYFAWSLYSGEIFQADVNNRTRAGFAIVESIVGYLGVFMSSLIIFLVGVGISALVLFSKDSD